MARRDPSESESEGSENRSSEEEQESEERNSEGQKREEISEYENQRLSRIDENKARMEALGLSKLASSLIGSPHNCSKVKGKRKVVEGDDDDDYRPNVGDGDDDNGVGNNKYSRSDKRKAKNKISTPKKKAPVQNQLSSSDYVAAADDYDELMRALALSLQQPPEVSGSTINEKEGNARVQEVTGRSKSKKSFTSRVQMTEDEVILHFFQFDVAGKGSINTRDLQRVAIAHDFTLADEELADMIHCFDSDGDGKLTLEDFRKIVNRCNMIQASSNA